MPKIEYEVVVNTKDSLAKKPHRIFSDFKERPADHFKRSGDPVLEPRSLNTEDIQFIGAEEHSHSGKIHVVKVMTVMDGVLSEIHAVSKGGKFKKSFADRVRAAGGCRLFKILSSDKIVDVNYDAMIPEEEGGVVSTKLSEYRWNKSYINFRAGNSLPCSEPKTDILPRLPAKKPAPQ